MHIPDQREHGQAHPPIDIVSDTRRLERSLTLGSVTRGQNPIQAVMASNSSAKAATQLRTFLGMLRGSRPNDKAITVTFLNVNQNADYILSEMPDRDLSELHPVRMTVSRGLAGPSAMVEEGHFVLILSDVEIVLAMKDGQVGVEKLIKLNARHFTVRADGVIVVHI